MTLPEAMAYARDADWVISAGDGDYQTFCAILDNLPTRKTCRTATMHVGSAYRENPAVYNTMDAVMFHRRFVGGDLFRLATEGPETVPFFAPAHAVIDAVADLPQQIVPCHASSHRGVKGTSRIERAVPDIVVLEGLSWRECTRRRAGFPIYVDQINDLGGYGAAAVEAMAAGCAVVGSSVNIPRAVDAFYAPPPIIEASETDLADVVAHWRRSRSELQERRKESLAWAQAVASPVATGRYWLRYLQ